MNKGKEVCGDSVFTLDELMQESMEMNNFLKEKTNQVRSNDNYNENMNKFFSRCIKLRNASKNICWEKNNISNNVS
jgi:hypothetical protein